jgi:superfamily I DNA/RNA helicase
MNVYESLNPDQRRAVFHAAGPALIVAGPGTGKTHTITMRIVHLLDQGVPPEKILALTFTKRAANEMRQRIHSFLSDESDKLFIGTFHKLGLEILMRECRGVVQIISKEEQIKLLREIGPAQNPVSIAERFSRIRNLLAEPDDDIKDIYEVISLIMRKKDVSFMFR